MRREAIARAGGKCVQCGDAGAGNGDRPGSELGFEYANGCAPAKSNGAANGGVPASGAAGNRVPASGELSKIWSRSKERIERELLRCVLLCRTCRTRKRSTERAETRGHGTITSYKYGCRCDECREVYNEYKRGWRARQAKENGDASDASVIDVTSHEEEEQEEVEKKSTPTTSAPRLRACG